MACRWFALLLLALEPIMAQPAQLTIAPSGGEDDAPALRAAIARCQAERIPKLVLAPGVYQLHPSGQAPHHTWCAFLNGVNDLTVSGPGATLLVHGVSGAFILAGCHNVTFEVLTLDYPRPAQSVGTVIASSSFSVLGTRPLRTLLGHPV